jgi:hypothetical protein
MARSAIQRKHLAFCVLLLFLGEISVYAYTDPGTGTLLWQTLLAALVGVTFYGRRFLHWLQDRVGRKKE